MQLYYDIHDGTGPYTRGIANTLRYTTPNVPVRESEG